MTDNELLELAAKAAGMDPPFDTNGVWSAWVGDAEHGHWWDPLNDDGDALRLAVKLHMLCDFGSHGVLVEAKNGPGPCTEVSDYRRAIVRAAAELAA